MELEFKPDWAEAVDGWLRWWNHEVADCAAIAVTAPREGAVRRSVAAPSSLRETWTNYEWRIDAALATFESTWYGGLAFPSYMPNLGPDCFASWLGCELEFMPTTSWARPLIDDWAADWDKIKWDPATWGWTWDWQLAATEAACQAGQGRFMVGIADLHVGMDAVAALRHPDRLCLDLVLNPEPVLRAMEQITALFPVVFDAMHNLVQQSHVGSTTWLTAYSPGRYYPVNCDFAALIGPHHFDQFELPDLVAACAWLDHSTYHLDGPDAICHVPSLASIEGLHAIQWVQGAGGGKMSNWVELLADIQSRGLGLDLAVTADEIEPLLEVLDPRSVLFRTSCRSEAEARDLLAAARGWTRSARQRVGAG